MQYNATTPDEYLEILDEDWRKEKLLVLRTLIKVKAFDFEECINYKMLAYQDEKGFLFHLNARRHYVSLYVGDAKKIDPQGLLLGDADVGKGCIRFKKTIEIDEIKMGQFMEQSIELWKRGEYPGC